MSNMIPSNGHWVGIGIDGVPASSGDNEIDRAVNDRLHGSNAFVASVNWGCVYAAARKARKSKVSYVELCDVVSRACHAA